MAGSVTILNSPESSLQSVKSNAELSETAETGNEGGRCTLRQSGKRRDESGVFAFSSQLSGCFVLALKSRLADSTLHLKTS
jgi:hypothetical protein